MFDLNDAMTITNGNNERALPQKYASRYGNEYYENLTACGVHKIDLDGLWQALQKSKPVDPLAGQIIEISEFCHKSLAEFGLTEKHENE